MSSHNGHKNHYKTIIIGSGPAGYTAAVYAARAEMKPLVIAGPEPGGQLMITTDVENYPGYPKGVTGPQMMEDFRLQAERFGTEIKYDTVTRVELEAQPKRLWLEDGTEYTADTVIISTGASAKWLGLPSEKEFQYRGVSACAVCDGYFFKDMPVAVVGAGDTAAEEALYLAKLCPVVHLIVRRDEMRASKIMRNRVLKNEKIKIHWNTETEEILPGENGNVGAVRVVNNQTGEKTELEVKGFFVAIGHKPNTGIFEGQLEMDNTGYLVTQADSTRTRIEGVFACGDAQDNIYRQAVTAAGTGCMAALDAERWLAAKEDEEAGVAA